MRKTKTGQRKRICSTAVEKLKESRRGGREDKLHPLLLDGFRVKYYECCYFIITGSMLHDMFWIPYRLQDPSRG